MLKNAPPFVAIHVEGRTIREAAEALDVSKSQVPNFANVFQTRLAAKIGELERKRIAGSREYKAAISALRERLYELAEESGSDRYDHDRDWGWTLSREDLWPSAPRKNAVVRLAGIAGDEV